MNIKKFTEDLVSVSRTTWYKDSSDPRSPHDAWLESLETRAIPFGDRCQNSEYTILLTLKSAYGGIIRIYYENVCKQVTPVPMTKESPRRVDWLSDQVQTDGDKLRHSISWENCEWIIECARARFEWNSEKS